MQAHKNVDSLSMDTPFLKLVEGFLRKAKNFC